MNLPVTLTSIAALTDVATEDPIEHWQFAYPFKQRILDLGCGIFGGSSTAPGHSVKYFLEHGAQFVVGIDIDAADLAFLTKRYAPEIAVGDMQLHNFKVTTVEEIAGLINIYGITAIKSDIEGGEELFLHLPTEKFRQVEHYWIEIHYEHLAEQFHTKFTECGYVIDQIIRLVHAGPVVYFAHRI